MIGNKIRKLREAAGLSQEKLAEKMDVTRQAVSKWENNTSVPEMKNLLRLSELFGVSVEEWTKDENEKRETSGEGEEIKKPEEKHKNLPLIMLAVVLGSGIILWICVMLIITLHSPVKGTMEKVSVREEEITLQEESFAESVPVLKEESGQETVESESAPDYLNSPESVALQQTAQNFARAYFQSDRSKALEYAVIAEENLEVWEKDVWDDLDYITLKWNPEKLAGEGAIEVQYEFRLRGEDSCNWLGLELMKIQDQWKVTNAYLEK